MSTTSLMLADDGSIYHLRCFPGDLAETIILVGDPARTELIANHFDEIILSRSHREFSTITGVKNNQKLTVMSTGIGAGGIDIVINEVDALFNMDLKTGQPKETVTKLRFVRFGTTGSLQHALPVGSLVTSAHAFTTDGLLNYYTRNTPPRMQKLEAALKQHFSALPVMEGVYASEADPELLALFAPVVDSNGITMTCNGFFGPQSRTLRTALPYPDLIEHAASFEFEGCQITNLEMETAVIYGLAEVLGHGACSISVVVANRRAEEVGSYHVAVEKMVLSLLDQLVSQPVKAP